MTTPRRPPGRPKKPEHTKLHRRDVWMRDDQWAKLREGGNNRGAVLRMLVDLWEPDKKTPDEGGVGR